MHMVHFWAKMHFGGLQLHTIEDVDRYILYLDNKNINSQINIFIGLLQPNERKLFIDFIGKKYLDPSFLS